MRKFNVTVNGNVYEVQVEEIGSGTTAAAPMPAPAPAAAPVAAPVAAPAAPAPAAPAPAASAASGASGTVKITAPMPGNILKVNVTVGQKVSKGDIVCVLEAMKMENDIPASEDGVVASVNVQNGTTVGSGDVLVTLN